MLRIDLEKLFYDSLQFSQAKLALDRLICSQALYFISLNLSSPIFSTSTFVFLPLYHLRQAVLIEDARREGLECFSKAALHCSDEEGVSRGCFPASLGLNLLHWLLAHTLDFTPALSFLVSELRNAGFFPLIPISTVFPKILLFLSLQVLCHIATFVHF